MSILPSTKLTDPVRIVFSAFFVATLSLFLAASPVAQDGLRFEVRDLVACSIAEFEVNGATPGDVVIMGYSLAGAGPTTTPFGVVDMTPPIEKLASLLADANGMAVHMQKIPPQAAGVMVYMQATSGGKLSNSLALMIL